MSSSWSGHNNTTVFTLIFICSSLFFVTIVQAQNQKCVELDQDCNLKGDFGWCCSDFCLVLNTKVNGTCKRNPDGFGIDKTQSVVRLLNGAAWQNISCLYRGMETDPRPTFSWRHNGSVIRESRQLSSLNSARRSYIDVESVDYSVGGDYSCHATIAAPDRNDDFYFKVIVDTPPRILNRRTSSEIVFVEGDENKTISCRFSGEPAPQVRWLKDRIELHGSPLKFDGFAWESVLNLPRIHKGNEGQYNCNVSNSRGWTDMSFFLKVVTSKDEEGNDLVMGIGISAFIAILLLACGLFLLWRKRLSTQQLRKLTVEEVEEFLYGKKDYQSKEYSEASAEMALALPFDRKLEVPTDELEIDKNAILGQGEFGLVLRGRLKNRPVAVKTTKSNTDVSYLKALLSELKLMAYLDHHENIVEFLGASTTKLQDNIIYAVVEFSPFGDLLSYMKKNRDNFVYIQQQQQNGAQRLSGPGYENVERKLSLVNFLNWSRQISSGMAYLEKKKVIHADLAARNVLVFPEDVVKISDFGLSRQMFNYSNYVKKSKTPVPWRWISVEALRFMEFSSKSDVWSAGVTFWEIFTLGQVPFPDKVWNRDFVEQLLTGLRLEKPQHATDSIYAKMLECWHLQPESRPSFDQLHGFFCGLLSQFTVPVPLA